MLWALVHSRNYNSSVWNRPWKIGELAYEEIILDCIFARHLVNSKNGDPYCRGFGGRDWLASDRQIVEKADKSELELRHIEIERNLTVHQPCWPLCTSLRCTEYKIYTINVVDARMWQSSLEA